MVVQALLQWLVLFTSLFAVSGFFAVILRGFTGQCRSNRAILCTCAGSSLVGSVAIWLLLAVTS